jgi:signal transduction histidine kinase
MLKTAILIAKSIIFRMIFWYSVILLVLFSTAFFVVYLYVSESLEIRSANELKNEADDLISTYNSKGIDELKMEFDRQTYAIGTKNICYSVLDSNGNILLTSDVSKWKNLPIQVDLPSNMSQPLINTLTVPGFRYKVQMAYAKLSPDKVLRITSLLRKDDKLLERLETAMIITISTTLVCVIIAGWIILRQVVGRVTNVTKTALSISSGSLDKRVPITNQGDEIDNLAQAFNGMLSRIEQLVQGLHEVTDNVAHDLKSPLTHIRIMAESLLTNSKEGTDSHQFAQKIIEESDRLIEMINTTLEIRAIDTGIATINSSEFDITELVQQACELFGLLAEEKGVTLKIADNSCPVMLTGDVRLLQRVFANLIDNAIKYTNLGGMVDVQIESDQEQVRIKITDTGIGIDQQSIVRIFERFYRTDQSRNMPGLGLGLSLAETIIKAHGGRINVSSTVGAGSIFTVILPRSQTA